MTYLANEIIRSRRKLSLNFPEGKFKKSAEEGGCGVVGFASSVRLKGRHIFQPALQMHNRGNGKGGGIAAADIDPAYLGVDRKILDECYLLQIALLDNRVEKELEKKFILPHLEVAHAHRLSTLSDYKSLGLENRPPDVKRYFIRVKKDALERFSEKLGVPSSRETEDEFIWQNSFKINRRFYTSLGEKRAFVLSHARNLMILKIVGYAENVVQYYQLEEMPARIWIAHQRYPTKGRVWHPGGAHPFIGMNEALVHNGDFANYHSVCEYLRQRNILPQFLTDTEVSVLTFDLWSRIYKYPLEFVIEALAPTTELDFDRLPPARQKIYSALQRIHMHGSPDGPWFFIIARSLPDRGEYQLLGITDTSMLRPQVFAFQEGEVQIGLCASEKQAIDATLESLSREDPRFRPIADKYWNARGGSHTDGGAFVFQVKETAGGAAVNCFNKFDVAVRSSPDKTACDFSRDYTSRHGNKEDEKIKELLAAGNSSELFRTIISEIADRDFARFRWIVERIVFYGSNGRTSPALQTLTLLNDRRYNLGSKKRSSVLQIIRFGINTLLKNVVLLAEAKSNHSSFRRITWPGRHTLRPPRAKEETLVVDASHFEPEGENSDAYLQLKAYELGWRRFIVFNLRGQRFHGCGFGPGTEDLRIDLYGSSGDYAGSGLDGGRIHIHGDAQDQLGQIIKRGEMVIHGSVGQTFMYGSKGGTVYVMGNAAGRPLINAVGRPRVVINGTCLDFLAESFMAGDALKGGGFVIVNGVEFNEEGKLTPLPLPYPGSNLFSLASGGALYIRDPAKTLLEEQLNGGRLADLTPEDWELIEPYLRENEELFGIKLTELLTVGDKKLPPARIYRKILPMRVSVLARELADEEE